jgi:malonate decarboxylase delta subunit
MEHLVYEFGPFAPSAAAAPALVGVVGSGNMEALFEPRPLGGMIRFEVDTSIAGFDATWRAVLRDFAERHRAGDLLVTINDAGATPSVVALRLAQAAEELKA